MNKPVRPFEFSTVKRLISEQGALGRIAELCKELNINRPLIVTDQGIVQAGLLNKLTKLLDEGRLCYASFCDVVADPPEYIVTQGSEIGRDAKVDGVIGFGGGSSLDTAKVVAALIHSDITLDRMYGVEQYQGGRLPLILIPTTAGTGSEVTPVAILTTGGTTKAGIVASALLPDIALLDAELTTGLPAHVTAATGIDAMVHAIEAFTSNIKKNPYSDLLAKEALRLMVGHLEQATFVPRDLAARQAMLLGACLAGQAFANAPVGGVHALAYPLGGIYHIPHGLSNSLVLTEVMRFNLEEAAPLYAQIARHLQLSDSADVVEQAVSLIRYLDGLIERLQLPTSLASVGVSHDGIAQLASDAMLQQRLLVNNPKQINYDDAYGIYSRIFEGNNNNA